MLVEGGGENPGYFILGQVGKGAGHGIGYRGRLSAGGMAGRGKLSDWV